MGTYEFPTRISCKKDMMEGMDKGPGMSGNKSAMSRATGRTNNQNNRNFTQGKYQVPAEKVRTLRAVKKALR
jgi:hypothetical protein